MTRFLPLVATLAMLGACSGYEDDSADVEAITPSEAEALDDAAEMIEQRRLPEGVLPDEGDETQGAIPEGAAPAERGGPEPMELPDE